ncbi:MAG: lipopolysaccharide heptosyltransferase I [Rhodocyclaceae bacterium]|nr:lipopolysaccharide heptosyltransferase I [Rhodocyclaceae bacterium]
MHILLLKTSSMGDLVHNCPAVSDILAHFPQASIDWVAEEAYVPIPQLHPGVHKVIPIAWRRWRKNLFSAQIRAEIRDFLKELRATRYDYVLDSQGLLKSVAIAHLAKRDKIVGGSWTSIREGLASCFYDQRLPISWSRHVVDRCRAIASGALGYPLDTAPRYGIHADPLRADWLPQGPYAVLMHAASRPEKLWAEDNWLHLGNVLATRGISAVLPWGSKEEKARSERLAARLPGAVVPPLMSLDIAARFLAGARVVVGLDTGFTHLAAALARPTVGIFCDSDSVQAAVYGDAFCESFGQKGEPPTLQTIHASLERALASA